MKVVILCGGYGTRLREQTDFIPKPLVPIGDKPILWHIIKLYYHQGFNEFILPLGYKGHMIKDYFLNYAEHKSDFTIHNNHEIAFHNKNLCEDWKIHFVETGIDSLTGKRIFLIKHLLQDDDCFMLTYGDGVANIDLNALLNFHKQKNKLATLTGFRPFHRFGLVEANDGIVTKFIEKPQLKDYVNCGFMILNNKALDYFSSENTPLESDVLPRLANDNQIAMYTHNGIWHYMDTQRDYEELNKLWLENPLWKIWNE